LEKRLEINQIFAKPTVSEWVAKINKDLKGAKTADDLHYSIEEGLAISAIQAHSPQDLKPISRNRDHTIACHIDTREVNCNANIKSLLNVGVNTLVIDVYVNVDYAEVLNGVILDYIQVVICPMEEGAEQKVLCYIKERGGDMNKIYSPSSRRKTIHIPFSRSVSDQLAQLLHKVNNSTSDDILLILDGQKDFLSEVAKIRAGHILLANLNKALNKEIKYRLLSQTKPSSKGVHELIQSSYLGLAAIIGEADGIVSVALDPKYKLNAVHTYNLIVMESYIGKVRDPAAGSDLIEEMTEAICKKSWAAFIEKV